MFVSLLGTPGGIRRTTSGFMPSPAHSVTSSLGDGMATPSRVNSLLGRPGLGLPPHKRLRLAAPLDSELELDLDVEDDADATGGFQVCF